MLRPCCRAAGLASLPPGGGRGSLLVCGERRAERGGVREWAPNWPQRAQRAQRASGGRTARAGCQPRSALRDPTRGPWLAEGLPRMRAPSQRVTTVTPRDPTTRPHTGAAAGLTANPNRPQAFTHDGVVGGTKVCRRYRKLLAIRTPRFTAYPRLASAQPARPARAARAQPTGMEHEIDER